MKTIGKILVIIGIAVCIRFMISFIGGVCIAAGIDASDVLPTVLGLVVYSWPVLLVIICYVGIRGIIRHIKAKASSN